MVRTVQTVDSMRVPSDAAEKHVELFHFYRAKHVRGNAVLL